MSSKRLSQEASPQADPLIGIRQVGDWLGISPSTIRRLVASGAFPAPILIGQQLRWRTSTIERYVAECEAQAGVS